MGSWNIWGVHPKGLDILQWFFLLPELTRQNLAKPGHQVNYLVSYFNKAVRRKNLRHAHTGIIQVQMSSLVEAVHEIDIPYGVMATKEWPRACCPLME